MSTSVHTLAATMQITIEIEPQKSTDFMGLDGHENICSLRRPVSIAVHCLGGQGQLISSVPCKLFGRSFTISVCCLGAQTVMDDIAERH